MCPELHVPHQPTITRSVLWQGCVLVVKINMRLKPYVTIFLCTAGEKPKYVSNVIHKVSPFIVPKQTHPSKLHIYWLLRVTRSLWTCPGIKWDVFIFILPSALQTHIYNESKLKTPTLTPGALCGYTSPLLKAAHKNKFVGSERSLCLKESLS